MLRSSVEDNSQSSEDYKRVRKLAAFCGREIRCHRLGIVNPLELIIVPLELILTMAMTQFVHIDVFVLPSHQPSTLLSVASLGPYPGISGNPQPPGSSSAAIDPSK